MSYYDTEETTTEVKTEYTFLWHSMGDSCRKCASLDGQRFEGQDIFNQTLYSPIWGNILDLETGRLLTHDHCRCNCEVQAEVTTIETKEIEEYQQFLEMLLL